MATSTVTNEDKFDRRTMINLSKGQYEWIREQAFQMKLSVSEVVRNAIRKEMDTGEQPKTG